ASKDKTIKIWQRNGSLISNIKVNSDNIQKIIFSPNNNTIATQDKNNNIKIWRLDGILIKSEKGFASNVSKTNMAFSSNGETIVIWGRDNTVKFIKSDGKEVRTIKSENQISVDFSPNGEIVAITKTDYIGRLKVELWYMNGTFLKTLEESSQRYRYNTEVKFTPDAQNIVIIDDLNDSSGKLNFWKRDGTLLSTFKGEKTTYSPNFQTLVTFEDNNEDNIKVKFWQRNGKLINTIQLKAKSDIQDFQYYRFSYNEKKPYFSPNGKIFAIQANKDTIELWRIDGTFLTTIELNENREDENLGYRESLSAEKNILLDFSLDSKSIAIRTDENTVEIWKLDNKASLIKKIKTKEGETVQNVNFLADSDTIAITTAYHTAKLWQLADEATKKPKLLQTFPEHKNLVASVSISPNAKLIASASHDKTVKLWQHDGELLHTFKEHNNKVNSVNFSPDGKLIASASDDRTVKIWQPDSGKVIKHCKGHNKGVKSVSFSPDGKMIASIGKDNTVKLWNIEGKDCKSLKSLNNSGDSVYGFSFSPNSQLIAISGENSHTLWSVNGTRLANFERLRGKDISFSPDGKSIAAAGQQGISVWDFDLDKLIKRGCNWARDYLKNNPNVDKSDRTVCDDVK
ncbi:MAG: WD40 repeat domain-containing protein, partial [Cyanobacteria bacterium J06635_10]